MVFDFFLLLLLVLFQERTNEKETRTTVETEFSRAKNTFRRNGHGIETKTRRSYRQGD